MAHLSLATLGALAVTLDGAPVAGFEYNKVRALLVYLAVESDSAHHREVLAELLWPERLPETARANLRKTLSTLRQAIGDPSSFDKLRTLEAATPPFLMTDRETVQFNLASDHTLDVAALMSLLDACRAHSHPRLEDCPECLTRLAQAVDVYHGDFLNQFFLNDSPAFDDWARSKREALRRLAMGALTQLAVVYEGQRDYEKAARYAQRQIELEPWAESAHRQLMRLYAALGQRSAALAQYEACHRALADELGVEPEADTTALYEQIRQARSETPSLVAAPTFKQRGGNPFVMRAMLKDRAAFVGRQAEAQLLFSRLASQQSCSIVGPRRIGKSSLLYYLTHPEVYRQHLPDAEAYIFAFVDLQELAGAGPEDFFRLVMERLMRAGSGRLAREPEASHTLSGFRRLLEEATERGLKLVLCCDEFETLSASPGFAADFFASLRGLSSNYNLALVTASHASLFELCHQGRIQTSHFWNIFSEHRLGLMPETEAHELIRHPAFTPEDQAFILRLAGPHPFFLSMASYHVLEARTAGLSPDDAIVEKRFFDEARRHYVYTWSRLNLADQQALTRLAQAERVELNDQRFQFLKDNTLLVGQAKSPALASTGWQRFIREQAVSE